MLALHFEVFGVELDGSVDNLVVQFEAVAYLHVAPLLLDRTPRSGEGEVTVELQSGMYGGAFV